LGHVADHGEGAPSDALPQLFEPFYHAPGWKIGRLATAAWAFPWHGEWQFSMVVVSRLETENMGGMEIHLPANVRSKMKA
jgi:hypothetical protein